MNTQFTRSRDDKMIAGVCGAIGRAIGGGTGGGFFVSIAVGFVLTLVANWFSFSFHAYQSELYPTRIRAQAIGFVYSWSRFSAIFSGFIIAFFLSNYGSLGVFGLIASAMLGVFIVIGFFGPRVTKRRLEAIAA